MNADKTKYFVVSRSENAGRSSNMKIDNGHFEWLEEFRYLGTTLTSQNSVQVEMKNSLMPGNAWYHSVRIFCLPYCYPKFKSKIHRTVILRFVSYVIETCSLTLTDERRLRVFEYGVLSRIFWPKRDEVTGEWKKQHNEKVNDLYC